MRSIDPDHISIYGGINRPSPVLYGYWIKIMGKG